MIAKLYNDNPNPRDVRRIADALRDGEVVILPTDTLYAFACSMEHKAAVETIARLKGFKIKQAKYSMLCASLSQASEYYRAIDRETFALLKTAADEGRINFVGNIEGTDVFNGRVDVVVTDGFTGNVLLKGTEGVIKYMMMSLKGVFYKSTKNKLAAAVLKKDLGEMKKSMDVNEVGGTAFVGISKPVVKAHGSSNAASFFAAIRQAKIFAESGIIEQIENNIDFMKIESEHA